MELEQELSRAHSVLERIQNQLSQFVVGQDHLRSRLLLALICEGHVLLEGVPGLAKTLSIKALASTLDAKFSRIQFTPDLLPADLIGSEVFKPQDSSFEIRKGPIFANFVLADEINRAPAKVQSALLETMQEGQVTIGEQTLKLPSPFFVMATQNPIEQEGTYLLPEAQVDRFMMKIKVDYPSVDEEFRMLELVTKEKNQNSEKAVATLDEMVQVRKLTHQIYIDDRVKKYIIDLVNSTRNPDAYALKISPLVDLGASPRATISLYHTAKGLALLSKENFVVPQMVKDVAKDVLRHRIILSYQAEAENLDTDDVIEQILNGVKVP